MNIRNKRVTATVLALSIGVAAAVGVYSIGAQPRGILDDTLKETVLSKEDFESLLSTLGLSERDICDRAIIGDYDISDIASAEWLDSTQWYTDSMSLTLITRGEDDVVIRLGDEEVPILQHLAVIKEHEKVKETTENSSVDTPDSETEGTESEDSSDESVEDTTTESTESTPDESSGEEGGSGDSSDESNEESDGGSDNESSDEPVVTTESIESTPDDKTSSGESSDDSEAADTTTGSVVSAPDEETSSDESFDDNSDEEVVTTTESSEVAPEPDISEGSETKESTEEVQQMAIEEPDESDETTSQPTEDTPSVGGTDNPESTENSEGNESVDPPEVGDSSEGSTSSEEIPAPPEVNDVINFYTVELSEDVFTAGNNTVTLSITDKGTNVSYSIKHHTAPTSVTTVYDPEGIVIKDDVILSKEAFNCSIEIDGDYLGLDIYCNEDIVISDNLDFSVSTDGAYKVVIHCLDGSDAEYNLFDGKSVIINNVSPVVVCTVDGEALENNWYTTADEISFDFAPGHIGVELTETTVSVNGTLIKESGGAVKVDELPTSEDGIYNILVSAKDELGNSTEETLVFKIDTDLPEFNLEGIKGIFSYDDVLYADNGIFIEKEAFTDKTSGIGRIEYKPSESESYFEIQVPYTITETTGYFRVYDVAGNILEISTEEMCGSVNIISDGVNVTETYPEAEYTKNGISYFKNSPVLSYLIDCEYIKSIECTVNGSAYEVSIGKDNTVIVDLAEVVTGDGRYNVTFKVTDVRDISVQKDYSFVLDTTAPEKGNLTVNGKMSYSDLVKGYVVEETVNVVGIAEDSGAGVKSVTLIKDGVLLESKQIDTEGNYTIEIIDNLGNKVELPIGALLSHSDVTKVIIDADMPTVEIGIDKAKFVDTDGRQWYTSKPAISYKISDVDLESYSIFINGTENKRNATEGTVSGDISLEDYKADTYDITVVAEDAMGHTYRQALDIGIDNENPELGDLNIDGAILYSKNMGSFLIENPVVLRGMGYDRLSGVKSVILYNGDKEVGSNQISDSGDYTVKITDNLGNTVTFAIGDLLQHEDVTSVIKDVNSPNIKLGVPNADYTGSNGRFWYKKNPKITYRVYDVDLQGYSISINGDKVEESKGISYDKDNGTVIDGEIDLSNVEGYTIDIVVDAIDILGHQVSSTIKIGVDGVRPNVSKVKADVRGTNATVDNVLYVNGTVEMSGTVSDEGVGIQSVTLYKGSDVEKVFEDNSVDYSITTGGVYTLKVVDNLGFERDLDILSLLNSERLVVDKANPRITRVDDVEESMQGWYVNTPTLLYDVADNNISSVVAYINQDRVVNTDTSGVITIDTSEYKNMPVTVRVVARDKAGNSREVTYSYTHDNTAPTKLAATGVNPVNEKGGTDFYNNPFSIQLSAEDAGVGIDGYLLDGKQVSASVIIGSNGSHTVQVYDKLGNTSRERELGKLLGWVGNTVVFDNSKPTISVSLPDYTGTYRDGWYDSDITFDVTLKDNVGIDNVSVKINGVEVESQTIKDLGVTEESLKISTSGSNPNYDGSYNVEITLEDNAKLVSRWSKTIYIDKTTPIITGFVISGDVKVVGKTQGGSEDTYGIFFDGKGSIQVNAADRKETSGIHSIWYKFDDSNWKEVVTKGDNSISVSVPENYKGSFRAYVVDNVGLQSVEDMPDGIISEDSNTHVNFSRIDITFKGTNRYDENNLPLYNSSTFAMANVSCDWAGLSKLEWGIGDTLMGTITDFSDALSWDKNIPLAFNTSFALSDNYNAQELWIRVTDNANRVSENSKMFSIDLDNPVVSMSFDKTIESGCYNVTRVATLTVKERNFDSSAVRIDGNYGYLGTWVKDGDVWKNTITFSDDGDYDFSVSCVDRAGNNSNVVESGEFTIDKEAPELSVSYSNANVLNGKYYADNQTVTLTIVERNFDANNILVKGADVSGWTSDGAIHTATLTFDKNGVYSIEVSGRDIAGNSMTRYQGTEFIIDKGSPEVIIAGVSKGVSYKGDVNIAVTVSDDYIDMDKTSVMLSGKNHEAKAIEGNLTDNGILVYSFSDFAVVEDVDDVYTLSVTATDKAGNTYTEEVTFSVNRFGSKFDVPDAELIGGYFNTAKDVVITELNVDKLDVSKVEVVVTLDGKQIEVGSDKFVVLEKEIDGKYLYTYTISKDVFTEDGKYIVQIFSTSEVGDDYTSAKEEYSFMIDSTAPTVILSGVEDNKVYNEYSRTVTLDIRDTSGVADVKVLLNGEEVETKYEDGIYSFEIVGNDERYEVLVRTTDLAGNTTETKVANFMITSNLITYLLNQTWVWVILILLILIVIALILILIIGILRRRKDEVTMAQEAAKYRSSSANSSNSSTSKSTKTGTGQNVVSVEDMETELIEDSKTDLMGEDDFDIQDVPIRHSDDVSEKETPDESATDIMGDTATDLMEEAKTDIIEDTATDPIEEAKTDIIDDDTKTDMLDD